MPHAPWIDGYQPALSRVHSRRVCITVKKHAFEGGVACRALRHYMNIISFVEFVPYIVDTNINTYLVPVMYILLLMHHLGAFWAMHAFIGCLFRMQRGENLFFSLSFVARKNVLGFRDEERQYTFISFWLSFVVVLVPRGYTICCLLYTSPSPRD